MPQYSRHRRWDRIPCAEIGITQNFFRVFLLPEDMVSDCMKIRSVFPRSLCNSSFVTGKVQPDNFGIFQAYFLLSCKVLTLIQYAFGEEWTKFLLKAVMSAHSGQDYGLNKQTPRQGFPPVPPLCLEKRSYRQ